jgi:hypothetical protein
MNEPRVDIEWLGQAVAEHVLKLSLFPSLGLHSTQAAALLPPLMQVCFEDIQSPVSARLIRAEVMHRHISRWLLNSQQLSPILDISDPALPLAALPVSVFQKLVLYIGLGMLSHSLRQSISREEVGLLRQVLGVSAMDFSLRCEVQDIKSVPVDFTRLPEQATQIGSVVLANIFERSSDAVGKRGLLRLPAQLDAAPIQSDLQSFSLAISALNFIDPEWLSSFPSIH